MREPVSITLTRARVNQCIMGTGSLLLLLHTMNNMANFSDDDMFEVDSILQQRKRKGILEYLVRWKASGADGINESWEPAKTIATDCAQAVARFLKIQKTKTKRSTSRSRKGSRSRSRSSSRSRKAAAKSTPGKSPARSRSRGRTEKKPDNSEEAANSESTKITRSSRSKASIITPESNTVVANSKAATESTQESSKTKSEEEEESEGRVLRSSTMKTREQLEVQRVHNEQRPVREDDNKPRSAIWKVADYAVIALFTISLLAALILFLEKFMDLEDFKKQAYPNMGVLQHRLAGAWQHMMEFASSGAEKISDVWLYVVEQIKGTDIKSKVAPESVAPGA